MAAELPPNRTIGHALGFLLDEPILKAIITTVMMPIIVKMCIYVSDLLRPNSM